LRSWAISLSSARSNAADLSSAAASARTTGPLVCRVISTRLALIVLSFVPLGRYLDLDPNHPVIQLFQPSDFFVHVRTERIRHCAVAGFDDNIHGYLHQ
jgi:hypothetical protein